MIIERVSPVCKLDPAILQLMSPIFSHPPDLASLRTKSALFPEALQVQRMCHLSSLGHSGSLLEPGPWGSGT